MASPVSVSTPRGALHKPPRLLGAPLFAPMSGHFSSKPGPLSGLLLAPALDADDRNFPDPLRDHDRQVSRLRSFMLNVDTQRRLLAAARRLRRSLPGDEKFGDPLSIAG